MGLWSRKSVAVLQREAAAEGEGGLNRTLSATNLMLLGIGAIIGAGIFVLTGNAAAQYAGPGVVPVRRTRTAMPPWASSSRGSSGGI